MWSTWGYSIKIQAGVECGVLLFSFKRCMSDMSTSQWLADSCLVAAPPFPVPVSMEGCVGRPWRHSLFNVIQVKVFSNDMFCAIWEKTKFGRVWCEHCIIGPLSPFLGRLFSDVYFALFVVKFEWKPLGEFYMKLNITVLWKKYPAVSKWRFLRTYRKIIYHNKITDR